MVTSFQFFISYLIVDVLCIALTIIIASKVSRDSGSETQVRYFFLVLTSYFAFTILDAVWALVAYSGLVEVDDITLSVVNALNLTAIVFAAYFWLGFTLAWFNSKLTDNRTMRWLMAIPAALVPVIHVIGHITGENVITLPDGTWTYGICHMIISLISMAYIAVATGVAIHQYRRATSRTDKRMSLVFIAFMVPFVVAAVVDSIVVNTPVVTASIMVSLAFVMMSMQESRISSDALTGMNNRRRAEVFLEDSLEHVSKARPLYLFVIDIDDFKVINDTYGHLEGDHALQLVASALQAACAQTSAFAARWGGDEFVLIYAGDAAIDPEHISGLVLDTLADTVRKAHVDYDISFSVGYASCTTPETTSAELIAQADAMMYSRKRIEK